MARCRYCYETGHNQRTCAKKTRHMKERADRCIAAGNPTAWAVHQYEERIAPKGKKVSQQKCGYCEERGHTRRKCEVLQKDREWFVQHHNEHVLAAHDYIVSSPLGIGSLFRERRRLYDYEAGQYIHKNTMFVLTDFELPKRVQSEGIHIVANLHSPDGRQYNITLRDYVINPAYGKQWQSSFLLIDSQVYTVPSNWVQRESIDFAFTANHEHFKRTGRKSEDTQDYTFNRINRYREQFEQYSKNPHPGYDYAAQAKEHLVSYTAAHNRAKIFEDFKSGQ